MLANQGRHVGVWDLREVMSSISLRWLGRGPGRRDAEVALWFHGTSFIRNFVFSNTHTGISEGCIFPWADFPQIIS